MRYMALGEVPAKRHVQVRDNGRLLVEEVMGYEGFSGNESILYHLGSPCRIAAAGSLTPSSASSGRRRRTFTGSPTCAPSSPAAIPSTAAGC